MTAEKTLQEIADYCSSHDLERFEKENLARDLNAIKLRLSSGEYRYTDFDSRSVFDFPRRTVEFFKYMQGYHARALLWANELKKVPLETIPLIVDLCPGWAPKIQLALHYLQYRGEVILFDRCPEYTVQLESFLEIFNPQFKIRTIPGDFFASSSVPTAKLVIANHVIDDLLIDLYCKHNKVALDDIYGNETIFLKTAEKIPSTIDPNHFASQFASRVDQFVESKGFVFLSHYPSLAERSFDLKKWIQFTKQTFSSIKERFIHLGYKDVSSSDIQEDTIIILKKIT